MHSLGIAPLSLNPHNVQKGEHTMLKNAEQVKANRDDVIHPQNYDFNWCSMTFLCS